MLFMGCGEDDFLKYKLPKGQKLVLVFYPDDLAENSLTIFYFCHVRGGQLITFNTPGNIIVYILTRNAEGGEKPATTQYSTGIVGTITITEQ